ncbi:hypothetical protein SMICM304S_05976 [Streptomyces microflavus]
MRSEPWSDPRTGSRRAGAGTGSGRSPVRIRAGGRRGVEEVGVGAKKRVPVTAVEVEDAVVRARRVTEAQHVGACVR